MKQKPCSFELIYNIRLARSLPITNKNKIACSHCAQIKHHTNPPIYDAISNYQRGHVHQHTQPFRLLDHVTQHLERMNVDTSIGQASFFCWTHLEDATKSVILDKYIVQPFIIVFGIKDLHARNCSLSRPQITTGVHESIH